MRGTEKPQSSMFNYVSLESARPDQTIGADKGYDTHQFVNSVRGLKVTPHVAVKMKGTQLDGRTTAGVGSGLAKSSVSVWRNALVG